jgi:hypothetical protein
MMMKADPVALAVLLPVLWAAHNVGDHLVQTDHQAMNKQHDWSAMAGHVGGYQAAQAVAVGAVLAATGLRPNRWALLVGTVVSAATHAFIDRRWPVRKLLMATRSPGFSEMRTPIFGMYQADQALHHGCLLIAALVMAARRG